MVFMVERMPRGAAAEGTLALLTDMAATGADFLAAASSWGSKRRQKRRVSSADADTTEVPSGLIAMWRTRASWPVSSAILTMEGYFQTQSWFLEKPWLETISLWCLDHWRAQTCDSVSMELRRAPVLVFQNLI